MAGVTLALLGLGFGLAYVNGANDVSKGIATLVGSGVTDARRAIVWGAVWTAVGGSLGAVLAVAMVATFGNGLLAAGTAPTLTAAVATLIGTALWVLIATRTGLPVSTTHAIVGSIAGVATVAYGLGGVNWTSLGAKVIAPLLLSPLLSLAAVMLLLRARGSTATADCLCADVGQEPVALASRSGAAALSMTTGSLRSQVVTGTSESCAAERPHALRLTLDHLHWLTSGATSLARGLNDTPKVVALVLAGMALGGEDAALPSALLFAVVAAGMTIGSLAGGRRVTRFLAEKVTPMDHREGLVANLVTAGLVTAGATLGLPMSTTHVASGAITGAGVKRSSLNRRALRDMALAWIVTLPASALLGVLAYAAGKAIFG